MNEGEGEYVMIRKGLLRIIWPVLVAVPTALLACASSAPSNDPSPVDSVGTTASDGEWDYNNGERGWWAKDLTGDTVWVPEFRLCKDTIRTHEDGSQFIPDPTLHRFLVLSPKEATSSGQIRMFAETTTTCNCTSTSGSGSGGSCGVVNKGQKTGCYFTSPCSACSLTTGSGS
jgi:hypothetical protein